MENLSGHHILDDHVIIITEPSNESLIQCLMGDYSVYIHHEFQRQRAIDPSGRKFLKVYEENIPYLKQANHCIECGICQSQCPMSVDIPKEMRRIDELVESLKVEELRK